VFVEGFAKYATRDGGPNKTYKNLFILPEVEQIARAENSVRIGYIDGSVVGGVVVFRPFFYSNL